MSQVVPLGPLEGVKILDLTRPVAGATCTWILSNMGAETISVDSPGGLPNNHVSYLYTGKKSITLDMKTEKGKDILRRLILWADVIVENFRPGVMERLGFSYQNVREINPRIIMTSISGYGQTGPYSQRGGFDTVGQAMGGLMSLIGPADGPPGDAGTNIADVSSGVFGALGTTLALYHQKTTGKGQHVEATLVESIVFFIVDQLVRTCRGDIPEKGLPAQWKRIPGAGWFQAKDGPWIVIMAQNDDHWRRLSAIIGRKDLAQDSAYTTRALRGIQGVEIHEMIQSWALTRLAEDIENLMEEAGIPFGRVQTLTEVLNDPQLLAREMFKSVQMNGETLPVFGPYPKLSDTPGSLRNPPSSGEHNDEVYGTFLGFSTDEIALLRKEHII
jgi:crotonobetainyl-CoA:carnitine CoA-transferase CaiB-like acyl-CoA transferase